MLYNRLANNLYAQTPNHVDMNITKDETQMLMQELAELKQEHRDLDIAIEEMAEKVHANQIDIKRLKKQKLKLKDAISRLESNLIPDLHA